MTGPKPPSMPSNINSSINQKEVRASLEATTMKLHVDPQAASWFRQEMGFRPQAGVRIKSRIYGHSPINSGFDIALESTEPDQPAVTYQAPDGLLFFIEPSDLWFFEDYDLQIAFDEKLDEPVFQYLRDGQVIHDGKRGCQV